MSDHSHYIWCFCCSATADYSQANPTGNVSVTQSEAIEYIHFLAGIATSLNMTIGLKNSLQILSSVSDVITFAVNEQCAFYNECYWYREHIASGKPVYQIEYPTPIPPAPSARAATCTPAPPSPSGMSLVFKNLSLDGYVVYCDGSIDNTDTKPGDGNAPPPRTSRTTVRPHPTTSSSKPTSTKPSTTRTTTSRPESSSPPTTTPSRSSSPTPSRSSPTPSRSTPSPSNTGQPGGCTSKHWDQCGGQNWKGCTVCAVRLASAASSNYTTANRLPGRLLVQIFESILFPVLII